MKNLMNKLTAAALSVLLAASATACGGAAVSSPAPAGGASTTDGGRVYKIGVIQYATHPSLDNCYEGFKLGLEEEGLKEGQNLEIDFQNAQNDMANSDIAAKNMIAKKYDLLAGIATPAAMSAYSASRDAGTPVVFTAVSDAVAAGIVKSNEKPDTNCTGSSDVLPLEQQTAMIRAFLPEATKIGVIYTTSEPNSVSHLKRLEEIGKPLGFEVVSVGVTSASEVAAAAASLTAQGVDCINNFTDNNVVDNLSSVLQAAEKAKIPVFGSEIEQVKNGCLASQGIDYVALGKETGKMAAKILKGEAQPQDTPVFMVKDCTPVYNKDVLAALGLSLPDEFKSAVAVENAG